MAMSLRALILGVLMPALVLASSAVICQEDASNSSAEAATSRTIIRDVPGVKWADGMCTFIGSLNVCLNYLGEKTTYPYLMGVSGAAFATRFHRDWRSSSADAALNDDHPKAALQAVGYAYTWATTGAAKDIMDSIERQMPVIGAGLAGAGDWGIVIGYERMGETWLCRTYYDKPDTSYSSGKVPWSALILGEKGKAPSITENARDSIKRAVEFAKGERKLSDTKYAVGFAAYDAWIEALESKKCEALTGKGLEETAFINAWLYNCLIDARYAGAAHLKWAAPLLNDQAKTQCEKAASLYESEIEILKGAKDYIKYPQNITSGPKWTADMRAHEVEALRQARDMDKEAVAALEKISDTKE
jgi:hypothetical protein